MNEDAGLSLKSAHGLKLEAEKKIIEALQPLVKAGLNVESIDFEILRGAVTRSVGWVSVKVTL